MSPHGCCGGIRGALGIATVARQRGVRRLHRHVDRLGVGVHQGRGAGNDPARPYAGLLGRRGGGQFGARHADPAEHPDDHLRRDRQRVDRRPVHRRHPARRRARRRVLRHDPRCSAYFRPAFVSVDPNALHGEYHGPLDGDASLARCPARCSRSLSLVGIVLGGIYGGFFTPTEAGGCRRAGRVPDRARPARTDAQDVLGRWRSKPAASPRRSASC